MKIGVQDRNSRLDVEMLDIPAKGCREVEKGLERFKAGSGGGGFGEIDTRLLSKTFRHIVYLVSGNLTSVIPLPLADKLAFEEAPPARN